MSQPVPSFLNAFNNCHVGRKASKLDSSNEDCAAASRAFDWSDWVCKIAKIACAGAAFAPSSRTIKLLRSRSIEAQVAKISQTIIAKSGLFESTFVFSTTCGSRTIRLMGCGMAKPSSSGDIEQNRIRVRVIYAASGDYVFGVISPRL
jgi:hypothetical protein